MQVYNNMLGDMDFFSDPAAALANAVVKTNDQLHRAVRILSPCLLSCAQMQHPVDCLASSICFIARCSAERVHRQCQLHDPCTILLVVRHGCDVVLVLLLCC